MKLIEAHIKRFGRGDAVWNCATLASVIYNVNCAEQEDYEAYMTWLKGRNVFFRSSGAIKDEWVKINSDLTWPSFPNISFADCYNRCLQRRAISDSYFEKRKIYGENEKRKSTMYPSLTELHPTEFTFGNDVSLWIRREAPHGRRGHLCKHHFYYSCGKEDGCSILWNLGDMDINVGPDGTRGAFWSDDQNHNQGLYIATYESMVVILAQLAEKVITPAPAHSRLEAIFKDMRDWVAET